MRGGERERKGESKEEEEEEEEERIHSHIFTLHVLLSSSLLVEVLL